MPQPPLSKFPGSREGLHLGFRTEKQEECFHQGQHRAGRNVGGGGNERPHLDA